MCGTSLISLIVVIPKVISEGEEQRGTRTVIEIRADIREEKA